MFQQILDGIFEYHNISTQTDKENFLNNLKQDVRGLRNSYNNFPVRFDYTNINVQASYLLAYFPHYTDLLLRALNTTGNVIANSNINDLILFGSGPCPEIIGFLRYLQQHQNNQQREINVTIYDIAVKEWKWSRDIGFNNVVPMFNENVTINRKAGFVDISQPFTIESDKKQKICVFQNCLNEITVANHNNLIQNINQIFNQLPVGSILIIIDLNFHQVLDLINRVEQNLQQNFQCSFKRRINDGEITHRTSQTNEPRLLLDNLLTDRFGETPTGLLPRRNVKFIYNVIEKT